MMTRNITIMVLIAGIVLGAAATEGFNVYRQSHASQIFQERARCKAAADAYVKENSTDSTDLEGRHQGFFVMLDQADYSPARNSCVAELETFAYAAPRSGFDILSVQDLLSGETLFSENCPGDCEVLKSMLVEPAFDYVMNNASIPLEQEEAWVKKKEAFEEAERKWEAVKPVPSSKSPPKSATPSRR